MKKESMENARWNISVIYNRCPSADTKQRLNFIKTVIEELWAENGQLKIANRHLLESDKEGG